jgi:hypothetical protein
VGFALVDLVDWVRETGNVIKDWSGVVFVEFCTVNGVFVSRGVGVNAV